MMPLRIIVSAYLLLLFTFSAQGQTLKGSVVDGETAKPLYPVIVVNLATQHSVSTDEMGNYSLAAKAGDSISFSYIGYHAIIRFATPGSFLLVELFPLSVKLNEYVIHDYTPFQRDSAEMTALYSKELNTKPVKIGFSSANGGGVTGLIGAPVKKMSRSYKRNKRFKENFKRDMEQKFIDTRYTPELVSATITLSGDTLITFMNTYPMEYNFARTATDLEVKMWIRNNYKEYLKYQTTSETLPTGGQAPKGALPASH